MKDSLKKFLASNGGNGLQFLELPTGFGKTTSASDFIFDYLLGDLPNKPKRIFYLTPLRKNVDDVYNSIAEKFREKQKEDLFKANALIIRANYEEVVAHLADESPEDVFTNLESYRILKSKVESYKSLLDEMADPGLTNNLCNDLLKQMREDFEPAFRRDVERILNRWEDCRTSAKKLARIKREHAWLLKIYPAMLTSERKVIFTTSFSMVTTLLSLVLIGSI